MAKKITLRTGRSFQTVKAAVEHFTRILDGQELQQPFSGDELADILVIYEDYCTKTAWPIRSSPAAFYPTYDRGPGYTTRCYGVTFEDGSKAKFSMPKALRAIAD